MKSPISWDITPPCYLLHVASWLAYTYFDSEDRDNMFLRNVGLLSTDFNALYAKIQDFVDDQKTICVHERELYLTPKSSQFSDCVQLPHPVKSKKVKGKALPVLN
jgi:hypothetical protein